MAVSSWSSGMGGINWSGTVNTDLTITGTVIEGSMGYYWTIKVNPTSTSDLIYGCELTLEEV